MVGKHKIEMVLTWYQRGYDVQLIAHHLGLDPRAVQDILRQAAQAAARPTPPAGKPAPPEFSDRPLWEGGAAMSDDMLDDAGASEEDILLTPDDVARMMRVSRRTVSTWRYRRQGPRYVRVTHNCVRYRISEVRKWLNDKETPYGSVTARFEAFDTESSKIPPTIHNPMQLTPTACRTTHEAQP